MGSNPTPATNLVAPLADSPLRLIIRQLPDRGFKSRPRNQFCGYARGLTRQAKDRVKKNLLADGLVKLREYAL